MPLLAFLRSHCGKFDLTLLIPLLFIGIGITRPVVGQESLSSDLSVPSWDPLIGNGKYKNPIIHADYSDPDVIRVGDDYYMTASSFNCVPGLPILHSRNLVHWHIIGHALPVLPPIDSFITPQHGNGVWAPSMRFHNDTFHIYYGDPDYGVYLVTAQDPAGPWSAPHLVKPGKGLIDPSPLWDDDGKAYLVHAFAGSRAGIKSILVVNEMSPDGTEIIGENVLVFDGHENNGTVEGPKFYKRNGYYYILAPAGGVEFGWQLALRSRNVYGPYEYKTVLHQGSTNINGPHQGGWVDTESGEDWFIHFQDKGPYGRVVHLNPVNWVDDWPQMGVDINNDGIGEPVDEYNIPDIKSDYEAVVPATSDEFNVPSTGLQWQWHANPHIRFGFPSASGYYRLNTVPLESDHVNLWRTPNLFLQKISAPEMTATTKIAFHPTLVHDRVGLIVMGLDYAHISVVKTEEGIRIEQNICEEAQQGNPEVVNWSKDLDQGDLYFRVEISDGGECQFSYSIDGKEFMKTGNTFTAKEGKWIGAKVGLFCISEENTNDSGYADIDWFRVTPND